jgi:hypothetical protein
MDLAELEIRIRSLEAKQAKKDLDELSGAAAKTEKATETLTKKTSGLGASYSALIGIVGRLVPLLIGAFGLREFIKANSEMEDLTIRLETFTGSSERALKVYEELEDLTFGSRASMHELTEAYVKFSTVGIEPTTETLKAFLDLTAGARGGVDRLTQAVLIASQGGVRALRQFGIRAVEINDRLVLSFGKSRVEVDKTVESITAGLEKISKENVAGAASRSVDTISGSFDQLHKSVSNVLEAFGRLGANKLLANSINSLAEGIKHLNEGLGETDSMIQAMAENTVIEHLAAALQGISLEEVRQANREARELMSNLPPLIPEQVEQDLQARLDQFNSAIKSLTDMNEVLTLNINAEQAHAKAIQGTDEALVQFLRTKDKEILAFKAANEVKQLELQLTPKIGALSRDEIARLKLIIQLRDELNKKLEQERQDVQYDQQLKSMREAVELEMQLLGLRKEDADIMRKQIEYDKILTRRTGGLEDPESLRIRNEYQRLLEESKRLKAEQELFSTTEGQLGMFASLERELELVKLTNEEREIAIAQQQVYNVALRAYSGSVVEATKITDQYIAKLKELREAQKQAEMLQRIADDVGAAFGSAFEDIVFGAKSAKEAMKDLYNEIARAIFRQLVTQQIATLISGFITASEHGNVFSGGNVIPFQRGGVVDSPSIFGLRGGFGTIAEHGQPEGILPLKRMAGGDLGVKAEGGGGVHIGAVNIYTPDADSFRRSKRQTIDDISHIVSRTGRRN